MAHFLCLPLDVAADGGSLVDRDGLISEDLVDRFAEILAGDGDAVSGTALVELAAIDQLAGGVEHTGEYHLAADSQR